MLELIFLAALDFDSGPFAGLEKARRPPRIEAFWLGLPHATDHASTADGIVALRPPIARRVRVAGGSFVMGSTPAEMQKAIELCSKESFGIRCGNEEVGSWIRAEGHAHDVTVSTFEIDATEVTVESYGRCVAAGGCAHAAFPAGDARYDRPTFPVTHVRHQDADNYCSWVGGRLPTEAEWELAARGRSNHTFPWGDVYNPRVVNHGAFADDSTDTRDGFAGLAPVGSFPDGATPTGILDMAGNVSEWVADWYERDEEGFGYRRSAVTNPKGPAFGVVGHVVRGGSFREGAHWMRTAARRGWLYPSREIGFRCAYVPAR